MLTPRLWQICCALGVIILLMAFTIKYSTSPSARWQDTSANAFLAKIENDLQQVYWLWQQQGRPEVVNYPGPKSNALFSDTDAQKIPVSKVAIPINKKGLPIVKRSQAACEQFIRWFVLDDVLTNQLKMAVSLEDLPNKRGYECKFAFNEHIYRYQPLSGELNLD